MGVMLLLPPLCQARVFWGEGNDVNMQFLLALEPPHP